MCLISADVQGHIGFRLAVEIPRRKRGFGTLPLPGWEEANDWEEGYLPFADMPFTLDPPEGYVATANNAPSHEPTPYLGVDWLDGYRQRAIVEALAGRRDWDLESMTALQRSVRSIPWEELRPTLLCAEGSAGVLRAVALLRAWDGQMSHDSIGASVYALFIAEITRRVVEQKAPRTARRALGEGFNPMLPHNTMFARRLGHIVRLLREQPPGFFAEGWAAPIAASLEAAVQRLGAQRGAAESAWAWGEVRPLRLVHLFSRVNPLLDRVFGIGPLPGRGDSSTIVQGTVDLLDPLMAVTEPVFAVTGAIPLIADPNDGLVTVESARWGRFLGCVPADHLDEVGQLAHLTPNLLSGFDHKDLYRRITAELHGDGL